MLNDSISQPLWSETALNYRMMVEGYSNLKEEVGGSNSGCEIYSPLMKNLQGGQLPHVLWRWPISVLCPIIIIIIMK
jgi:hypothetical protein